MSSGPETDIKMHYHRYGGPEAMALEAEMSAHSTLSV